MWIHIYVQKDKKIKQARKKGIDFSHYRKWTTRKHTLRQTEEGTVYRQSVTTCDQLIIRTLLLVTSVRVLLVNTGQGVQSGCTSRKRGQSEKWCHFWISVPLGWVHACFSKLHLGRVIYSNNTASHGKGEGLKEVKRSLPQRAVGYSGRRENPFGSC